MTYANRKKLYDHYVKEGMTERAEAIAKAHPDVLDKSKEETPTKKGILASKKVK